jgi:hypothetical protein
MMAGPLVPANHSPLSNFQQQGSVDWVQLSRSSLTLSIEVLGRLSRAGIETITIAMGQALCSSFNIPSDAQHRISSAISKLKVTSSYNSVLWFGFGVKNIVRSLVETEQGIACVAICGCLSISYDEHSAAQLLREMARSRAAPEELKPSLSQWGALINACSSTLAASDFPNVVEGFSRLWWESPEDGKIGILRSPASSQALSSALIAIANVSNKTLLSVTLVGGPDCAWLAAIAEWLLCLRIDVVDTKGRLLYRNFNYAVEELAQVSIIRDSTYDGLDYLIDKAYLVPSGSPVWKIRLELGDRIFSHGRSGWSTILEDTFGPSLKRFLNTKAAGHFYHNLESDRESRSKTLALALNRLPELQKSLELSSRASGEAHEFEEGVSESVFKSICGCSDCGDMLNRRDARTFPITTNVRPEFPGMCLHILTHTVVKFVKLIQKCQFDENVQPSSTGLGLLYLNTRLQLQSTFTFSLCRDDPRTDPLHGYLLADIFQYITGMPNYNLASMGPLSALSRSGLALHLMGFQGPDVGPAEQTTVQIIPGYIERDQFTVEEVYDLSHISGTRREDDVIDFSPFHAESFNMIRENCNRHLPLQLMVKETIHGRKLQASYVWQIPDDRFSTKNRHGDQNTRTMAAFGLAQLRTTLLKKGWHRNCQNRTCVIQTEQRCFDERCCLVDLQARQSSLGHNSTLFPQTGEMVLVREGEMGGPYIYEDASPETRIQRSHQMRMLYSLLCNPAGPMSAYIVEVGHCILCVAGWRARRIIIDNDRSNLGETVPEEIPYAEILKQTTMSHWCQRLL